MKHYPITATFLDYITVDIPCNNYTKKQWSKELDYMQKVGIDTLVFIRGYYNHQCLFDSKHFESLIKPVEDIPEIVFSEADKRGMKVFMGLYMYDIDWQHGNSEHEIKQNKIFIDEAYERYKHHKSFYGWYIPHEVGTDILNISDIFREISKMCHEKDPSKKILVSPFFHTSVLVKEGGLSPEEVYVEFDKIFSKSGPYIDIAAFQDTSAPIDMIDKYFAQVSKVCKKYNITCWDNVEMLCRHTRDFYPIDINLLNYKVEIAKPYVDGYMTFEFSHFMSPQSLFTSARGLYEQYKELYKNK